MIIFAVITEVPADDDLAGNMALAGMIWLEVEPMRPENDYKAKFEPISKSIGAGILALRQRVFELGEILILDGSGREVGGMGRKPSKWSVTTEEFDDIEAAVARSREVTGW